MRLSIILSLSCALISSASSAKLGLPQRDDGLASVLVHEAAPTAATRLNDTDATPTSTLDVVGVTATIDPSSPNVTNQRKFSRRDDETLSPNLSNGPAMNNFKAIGSRHRSLNSKTSVTERVTKRDQELPLQPRSTPALIVAGLLLLLLGPLLGAIGIKIRWLQTMISAGLLISLGVTVLILYVMSLPVSNVVQGAYLVAVGLSGVIVGLGSIFLKSWTEGLSCLLGGFTISMWILTLREGGTIQNEAGTCILISLLCMICWGLSFNARTRETAVIGMTSFAGATVLILGIDFLGRAGLKEFWVYLWNVNSSLFPPTISTYPITRGIRAETIAIPLLCLLGIFSQLRFWTRVRRQRSAEAQARDEEKCRSEIANNRKSRLQEREIHRERTQWEKAYSSSNESDENLLQDPKPVSARQSVRISVQELAHERRTRPLSHLQRVSSGRSNSKRRSSLRHSTTLEDFDESEEQNLNNGDVAIELSDLGPAENGGRHPSLSEESKSTISDGDPADACAMAVNRHEDNAPSASELPQNTSEVEKPGPHIRTMSPSFEGLEDPLDPEEFQRFRDDTPEQSRLPQTETPEPSLDLAELHRPSAPIQVALEQEERRLNEQVQTSSIDTIVVSSAERPSRATDISGTLQPQKPDAKIRGNRASTGSLMSAPKRNVRVSSTPTVCTSLVASPINEDAEMSFDPQSRILQYSSADTSLVPLQRQAALRSSSSPLPLSHTPPAQLFESPGTSMTPLISVSPPSISSSSASSHGQGISPRGSNSSRTSLPSSFTSSSSNNASHGHSFHNNLRSSTYPVPDTSSRPTYADQEAQTTLADLRSTIRRESVSALKRSSVIDSHRAEMMEQKRHTRLSTQLQEKAKRDRNHSYERSMRTRLEMQDLHRSALRKMQEKANQHI